MELGVRHYGQPRISDMDEILRDLEESALHVRDVGYDKSEDLCGRRLRSSWGILLPLAYRRAFQKEADSAGRIHGTKSVSPYVRFARAVGKEFGEAFRVPDHSLLRDSNIGKLEPKEIIVPSRLSLSSRVPQTSSRVLNRGRDGRRWASTPQHHERARRHQRRRRHALRYEYVGPDTRKAGSAGKQQDYLSPSDCSAWNGSISQAKGSLTFGAIKRTFGLACASGTRLVGSGDGEVLMHVPRPRNERGRSARSGARNKLTTADTASLTSRHWPLQERGSPMRTDRGAP